MDHATASAYVSAPHIYFPVSPQEAEECPLSKYVTSVEGGIIMGVDVEYPPLVDRELVPEPIVVEADPQIV